MAARLRGSILGVMTSTDAPVADLSNWRSAPYSRWAFQNIRTIMPVASIASSPDGGALLGRASAPGLGGFRVSRPGAPDLDLAGFLEATATDGIVVLHHGHVVLETYANGLTADRPHILMSATKSITGLIAGMLTEHGLLDPEALVTAYVPEVAATAWAGATVRHLLDMRTGVVLDAAQQEAGHAAAGWAPMIDGAPDSLHGFLAGLEVPHAPHGGPFRYTSANTDLLGWVIERAADRPFADLVSALLWKPMGAEEGAFVTVDRRGAPRCTGGIGATVRDLARIGRLVAEGGGGIIPADWIADVEIHGDRQAWATGEWARAFSGISRAMSYRNGWYIIDGPPQILFAMGIHGQNLFVDRANGIVIAKVSSQGKPIDHQALPLTHAAVDAFRRCLTGDEA